MTRGSVVYVCHAQRIEHRRSPIRYPIFILITRVFNGDNTVGRTATSSDIIESDSVQRAPVVQGFGVSRQVCPLTMAANSTSRPLLSQPGRSRYGQRAKRPDLFDGLARPSLELLQKPSFNPAPESVPNKATIKDVQYIGSYNWLDHKEPTIVVPGISVILSLAAKLMLLQVHLACG